MKFGAALATAFGVWFFTINAAAIEESNGHRFTTWATGISVSPGINHPVSTLRRRLQRGDAAQELQRAYVGLTREPRDKVRHRIPDIADLRAHDGVADFLAFFVAQRFDRHQQPALAEKLRARYGSYQRSPPHADVQGILLQDIDSKNPEHYPQPLRRRLSLPFNQKVDNGTVVAVAFHLMAFGSAMHKLRPLEVVDRLSAMQSPCVVIQGKLRQKEKEDQQLPHWVVRAETSNGTGQRQCRVVIDEFKPSTFTEYIPRVLLDYESYLKRADR